MHPWQRAAQRHVSFVSQKTTIEEVRDAVRSAGVKLSPTLAEAQVADYEQLHGIRLPSDYRAFVLHVGNGSTGSPSYGLCRLGNVPSDFDLPVPNVSKVFPFTKPWVWENGNPSAEGVAEDVNCGVLILGTDGCAQYWALVVNGPEFGNVWMLTDVGITPTVPRMTFLEWYRSWIRGKRDWWS